MSSDEDEAVKPAIYGSSIKKDRINFVPASKEERVEPVRSSRSLGEQYLAIVLKGNVGSSGSFVTDGDVKSSSENAALCDICRLPVKLGDASEESHVTNSHDLSLAHQVCVHHSYPPSHLDRNRPGLRYLSSYGWDVDSRKGLGVTGDGRLAPVKATAKNNTVGLGIEVPKDAKRVVKPILLDAGKVRKKDVLERRRRARLQEMFYQNEDVERYLGSGVDPG